MEGKRPRVVIVGGGFGGLEVAKGLGGANVDVLLVDRANYHLFQPLLYQVAIAGLSPAEIASPIREILWKHKNVRVLLGEVTNLDLEERRVHVTDPIGKAALVERYDYLVLAVGAKSSYFGNDDWEVHAPGLKSVEDALEIRRRVLLAFEAAERVPDPVERRALLTFAVIGGGPTGVELSGAISELAHHVLAHEFRAIDPRQAKIILIEAGSRILPSFPEDLAQRAVEQLAELNVEVQTSARVVGIDEDGVELDALTDGASGRRRIHSRTVLWGAGVRGADLGSCLGVATDRQARIIVGPDCSVPGHPNVFAIGDIARFEEKGQVLPGVSPVAMQQGRHVAAIIAREAMAAEAPPRPPFSYRDKGSMATIGRSRAIAWTRGIKMHGFVAWLAWLFIHVFYLIGFRNRLAVVLRWFWSYISYERGSRLITWTGWRPTAVMACAIPGLEASRERAAAALLPAELPPPSTKRSPPSGRLPAPSVH